MQEATIPLLNAWNNFYVIIGSASAALTGLTFVIITLIARIRQRDVGVGIAAFSTPIIVHFCVALFISVLLSAPWQMLWHPSLLLGLVALGGNAYLIIVLRRALRQSVYQPVLEDWLWHIIFPFIAYIVLVVAAIVLPGNPVPTLFVVGAVTVMLLFIGIHNSWDNVTYITIQYFQLERESQD